MTKLSLELFSGHKGWVLFLCFLAYTFNYVDRQILIILAEPIKQEFQLHDWQLGFLTGTAFALFYAVLGIPIAFAADRWNRVNIIAISVALWSAMTAACAFTGNYMQLLLARIGVGVGEAGGSPPASSLLASYFQEGQRATAMGIYSLGPSLGLLLGFIAGGWVNEFYGWRVAMLVVGLPGIILALLIKITLKEPQRTDTASNSTQTGFLDTVRYLTKMKTFNWSVAGAVLMGFSIYAFMTWMPIYLIRQFRLTSGEVGTTVGLCAGLAGSLGVFAGGYLTDRLSRINPTRLMLVPAVATALFYPLAIAALNAHGLITTVVFLVPTYALTLAHTGPTWAVLQGIAPENMRAMAAAIMLLCVNLFGLGLGPQAVGIFSDIFQDRFHEGESLRIALAICMVPALLAAACYARSTRTVVQDLKTNL